MITTDFKQLEGKTVLVRSLIDDHNPPIGVRGWIHVVDTGEEEDLKVEIVLEFPDMFEVPAHERMIVLRRDGVDRLLASEKDGVFEWVIPGPVR
jgi:hypothetical protein